MEKSFKVVYRNPGHWDIYAGYAGNQGRIFRLRGGPGEYTVLDERKARDLKEKTFKTVQASMSYICDSLMYELIVADGQEPIKIESWNV